MKRRVAESAEPTDWGIQPTRDEKLPTLGACVMDDGVWKTDYGVVLRLRQIGPSQ